MKYYHGSQSIQSKAAQAADVLLLLLWGLPGGDQAGVLLQFHGDPAEYGRLVQYASLVQQQNRDA